MPNLYSQDLFEPKNFNGKTHQDLLQKTAPFLQQLKKDVDSGALPILSLSRETGDFAAIEPAANAMRGFKQVLILGTGGSSLGGKALYALADAGFGPRAGAPQLYFLDNVDPNTFAALFEKLRPAETGVVAISKSGSTAETLCQLHAAIGWIGPANAEKQILALTEPGDNALRALAAAMNIATLDHNPKVGGRFSVLSNVGMLPALIAGLDAKKIRAGAKQILDQTLQSPQSAPAIGAVMQIGLGVSQSVLMPYCDRLSVFAAWYKQLWAESLGKNGRGTTPVNALGTVDQHSQLQLYLEGPKDKFFTIVTVTPDQMGQKIAAPAKQDTRLNYLYGRTMGDLLAAEARATIQTLRNKGLPVRVINVPRLCEESLGALFMHFMLETIIAADLLGVNPYDQPAVEEGKILTKQYLQDAAA